MLRHRAEAWRGLATTRSRARGGQPAPGLAVVRQLLCDDFELVAVHSLRDALERLTQGGIDLILAGLQFDESITPALLEAVKFDPSTRGIPVVCCRFLPTQLQRASLHAAAQVCEALGAQFIDVLELQHSEGHLGAALCLRGVMLQALRINADLCQR